MKVYKVTVIVVDSGEVSASDIRDIIENMRYPNHCMRPRVVDVDTVELGEWDDSLPINKSALFASEVERLFPGTAAKELR